MNPAHSFITNNNGGNVRPISVPPGFERNSPNPPIGSPNGTLPYLLSTQSTSSLPMMIPNTSVSSSSLMDGTSLPSLLVESSTPTTTSVLPDNNRNVNGTLSASASSTINNVPSSISNNNLLDTLPDLTQLLQELENNSSTLSSFPSLLLPLDSSSPYNNIPSPSLSLLSYTNTHPNASVTSSSSSLTSIGGGNHATVGNSHSMMNSSPQDVNSFVPNNTGSFLFPPSTTNNNHNTTSLPLPPNPSLTPLYPSSSGLFPSMVPLVHVLPLLQKIQTSNLLMESMQKTMIQAQEYVQNIETNYKNILEQQRIEHQQKMEAQIQQHTVEKTQWSEKYDNLSKDYEHLQEQLRKETYERQCQEQVLEKEIATAKVKEQEQQVQMNQLQIECQRLQNQFTSKNNELVLVQNENSKNLKNSATEYATLQQSYRAVKDNFETKTHHVNALCASINTTLKNTATLVLENAAQYDKEYISTGGTASSKAHRSASATSKPTNSSSKKENRNETNDISSLIEQLEERTRLLAYTIAILHNDVYLQGITTTSFASLGGNTLLNNNDSSNYSTRSNGNTESDENEWDKDDDNDDNQVDDEETKQMISAVEKAFHEQIGSVNPVPLSSTVQATAIEENYSPSTTKSKSNPKKKSNTKKRGTGTLQKPILQFLQDEMNEEEGTLHARSSTTTNNNHRSKVNDVSNTSSIAVTESTASSSSGITKDIRSLLEQRAKAYAPKFLSRNLPVVPSTNESTVQTTDDSL